MKLLKDFTAYSSSRRKFLSNILSSSFIKELHRILKVFWSQGRGPEFTMCTTTAAQVQDHIEAESLKRALQMLRTFCQRACHMA